MNQRKALYKEEICLADRNFCFEIRESRIGKLYLVISEEKKGQKQNLIIFENYLKTFFRHFQESCKILARQSKPLPWNDGSDSLLKKSFSQGFSVPEIAKKFQRSQEDILRRLVQIGELSAEETGIDPKPKKRKI